MKTIYAIIAFLFMSCSHIPRAEKDSSVVSVLTSRGMGSGFFVSKTKIITNAHVCKNNAFVAIKTNRQVKVRGRVIKKDHYNDFCLVKIDEVPHNVFVAKIAKNAPSDGERLFLVSGRTPRDFIKLKTKGYRDGLFYANGKSYLGTSGSPIYNQDREVVAVMTYVIVTHKGKDMVAGGYFKDLAIFLEGEL